MAQDLDFPDHLGSRCTDRVLMNVARPRNAIDILEYGTQDLLYNVHTDIVIITAEQRKIGIHACVINSASSVVKTLMSSISNPGLKQVIFLPDFSSSTVVNLRCLLYGSSLLLSKDEIKNLNLLNNLLNIHQKLNLESSSNSAQSTNLSYDEVKERDIGSYDIKSRDKTMLGQIEITRNHRPSHQDPHRETDTLNLPQRQNCDSNSVYWERSQATETLNDESTLIDQNSDSLSCQPNLYILHNDGKTISQIGFETPQECNDDRNVDGKDSPTNMEKQLFMEHVQLGRNHKHIDGYLMEGTDFIDNKMSKSNEDNVNRKKSGRYKTNDNRPASYGIDDSVQSPNVCVGECDGENTHVYNNEENEGAISGSDEAEDAQYNSKEDNSTAPQSPENQNATVATTQLTESLQEETVKTVGNEDTSTDVCHDNQEDDEELPLLCWYCNKEFHSFQSLCDHINTHSGSSKFSRRHHRCPRCGEVLHSTWKLRQHLTTHHTEKLTNKEDHQYAERPRKTKTVSKPKGDHGYATITVCKQNEQSLCQKQYDPSSSVKLKQMSKEEAGGGGGVSADDGKRKRRRMNKIVCSEHSYGTTRDSSPETEQTDEHKDRSDHAYSYMHAPPQLDPQQNDTHNITTSTHNSEAATNEISQHHDKAVTVSAKLKTSKQTMNMRRKLKSTKIFPCSQCIKTFPQKYRLNRHVREVHDKEKFFKCEQCTAEFFKSSSLLRHMVSVHIEYRPYNCKLCTAAFKDNKALKYHEENKVCLSTNYKVKLEKIETN